MAKATVAILRTKPETVQDDYRRLCELAGLRRALDASATTILKDNITWHNVFPGVNTTPWQLEGTILALKTRVFPTWSRYITIPSLRSRKKAKRILKFKPIYRNIRRPGALQLQRRRHAMGNIPAEIQNPGPA